MDAIGLIFYCKILGKKLKAGWTVVFGIKKIGIAIEFED